MKRIVLFLLVLVMVFSLCACSKNQGANETTGAATTAPQPTQPAAPAEPREPLQPLLDARKLPALKSREEMLDILQKEMYGYIPEAPTEVTYTVEKDTIENYAAGKANIHKVTISGKLKGNPFSFPFITVLPKSEEKVPFFVHIAFSASNTSRFQPTEELVDNGYAVLFFNYEDVASDNSKFDNGVCTALYPDGKRGVTDAGKIAIWAWAAMRVMDYAEKELADKLDMSRSIVCGHSRLGKTALLAGAYDTRFQYTYSNDSGCTGAAISRHKTGEDLHRVINANPFWYCTGFNAKYDYGEYKLPFDQHYLLACVAPRKLLVGSAIKDKTADPLSEQLACLAASPAFTNGFACTVVAKAGEEYFEGDIGYHVREGTHYFHREDWQKLMKFVEYHTSK